MLLSQQASGTTLVEFGAHGASATGTKRLELGSCREAREAVVLLIAVTLDPEAALVPEPENPGPAPIEEPSEDESSPRPRSQPAVVRAGSLGALVAFDPWSLRKPTAGPAVLGALSFGLLQLHLAVSYLFARDIDPLPTGASGKVDLFSTEAGAGLRFATRKVAGGPLTEVELGALRGLASGVPAARTQTTLWVAVLAGLWLELPATGRLSARLSVLGGVPLRRPRFDFQGGPVAYTAPVAFLRLQLGLVFRFGASKE